MEYGHSSLTDVWFHESSVSDSSVKEPNFNICLASDCIAHNFTNFIHKVVKCDEKQWKLIRLTTTRVKWLADVTEPVHIGQCARALELIDWPRNDDSLATLSWEYRWVEWSISGEWLSLFVWHLNSQFGDYEEYCLLRYSGVYSGRSLPTLWGKLVFSFPWSKRELSDREDVSNTLVLHINNLPIYTASHDIFLKMLQFFFGYRS